MTLADEAADLLNRLNTRDQLFAGSTPVPYSQRHHTRRPDLTGAPEPLPALHDALRAFLRKVIEG